MSLNPGLRDNSDNYKRLEIVIFYFYSFYLC